jgi:hypothetical protein
LADCQLLDSGSAGVDGARREQQCPRLVVGVCRVDPNRECREEA